MFLEDSKLSIFERSGMKSSLLHYYKCSQHRADVKIGLHSWWSILNYSPEFNQGSRLGTSQRNCSANITLVNKYPTTENNLSLTVNTRLILIGVE